MPILPVLRGAIPAGCGRVMPARGGGRIALVSIREASRTEARAHVSARVEDAVVGAVGSRLGRRGWRPRVLAYTGYGAPGWVRVFARVLLSPPRRPGESDAERRDPQRGWRAFVTLPVARCVVTVDVGSARHQVVTDRSGYVDVRLPVDLEPGWHPVTMSVEGQVATNCDVRVVHPSCAVGIVSDIDDTVMVTLLPRPLIAAWNTFVLREHARRPVPGMARMLSDAVAAHPTGIVVYLSTGAWNVAPTLERFLARHGYPPGPLLLTDWGPTRTGWFRSGVEHKRTALRRLVEELPHLRWLLVGDDGQHDPEIYGAFAEERRDKVLAVAIRQLTPTEQVLASGSTAPAERCLGRRGPVEVPWVAAADGTGLAGRLRTQGLL